MSRVNNFGKKIVESARNADDAYCNLLKLNPNSIVVLRAYSNFLREVQHMYEKAETIEKQAALLEENESRLLRDSNSNINLFG